MFSHLLENITLKINQFFTPGDSCINHVLVDTHESYSSFDVNYEIRGYTTKVFEKLCHEGIIHKLQQNRISGNLIKLLIKNVIKDRKHMVVLSGSVHLELISALVSPQVFYSLSFSLSISMNYPVIAGCNLALWEANGFFPIVEKKASQFWFPP